MALAGRWAFASKRMAIPMPALANRPARFPSFRDGFRKCRVPHDSIVDRGARDSQSFRSVFVIHAFAKQAKNQPPSNVKFLGHEGKFAENRVDVEFSAFKRVGCVQPATLTNA